MVSIVKEAGDDMTYPARVRLFLGGVRDYAKNINLSGGEQSTHGERESRIAMVWKRGPFPAWENKRHDEKGHDDANEEE